ncbi:MAG: hypothetical protein [Circular genetic element sp.]|nr:MAG: hypothetical protein [Circular genetic element sp.]
MAKKKYSTRMKKIEPAVQTLRFAIPITADPNEFYIDLSQCASLVNRRFYRQGINWAVSGFKFLTNPQITGNVIIGKLPNTWVMSNAWEKGFRNWQRMNNEALSESQSIRPRFLDFKIFADAAHHALGFGANVLPSSISAPYVAGEWESSKYAIPFGSADPGDTEEFEVIATGASFPGNSPVGENLNAVSLIEGYAASRGLPNVLDPNRPDDASDSQGIDPENWLQALFNEGTDQSEVVLDDMITENNIAPYPFENDGVNTDTMYPNGANQGTGLMVHDVDQITGTTIGGITRMKGGMFPCGLIAIGVSNVSGIEPPAEDTTLELLIELVPGNHRGYLCEPMTDM